MVPITEEIARKVVQTVDCGLVKGLGQPTPGQMCVEAAVCYALGLPHHDDPGCISPALRSLKIALNDADWSTNDLRAAGLRRLAVAQLGSKDVLNEKLFLQQVSELVIRKYVPIALRAAANVQTDKNHKENLLNAAERCEQDGTKEAAENAKNIAYKAPTCVATYAADAAAAANVAAYAANVAAYAANVAAYAAYAAASADPANKDKILADFAEDVVQILIGLNASGCQWLYLTESKQEK